ncbi:uncharacterized protein PHALS_14643 [Plasmopara halstedii]|uniref:Uncharacterized protein n=1 Tax=Plasmopara halstedii TaxID=4781 RepID=A0A0P1ASK5_PLAHL|nr:uncharacterized protein PHALS_14643 [Plasmopara halstedii]CEG44998.1 hypothetical protein PHALS_14643 [Plasmopara halstedii]|eukprot:XP_024581367.1 hypothetical protein PHALS_14643 [Plasmopara halstedii]
MLRHGPDTFSFKVFHSKFADSKFMQQFIWHFSASPRLLNQGLSPHQNVNFVGESIYKIRFWNRPDSKR